jgi:hypothetical protein
LAARFNGFFHLGQNIPFKYLIGPPGGGDVGLGESEASGTRGDLMSVSQHRKSWILGLRRG